MYKLIKKKVDEIVDSIKFGVKCAQGLPFTYRTIPLVESAGEQYFCIVKVLPSTNAACTV